MNAKTKKLLLVGGIGLGALLLGTGAIGTGSSGSGSVGGQDSNDDLFPLVDAGESPTYKTNDEILNTTSTDQINRTLIAPEGFLPVSTEYGTAYTGTIDGTSGTLYALGTGYDMQSQGKTLSSSGFSYYNPKTGATGEFVPSTSSKSTNTTTKSPTSGGSSGTSYFKTPTKSSGTSYLNTSSTTSIKPVTKKVTTPPPSPPKPKNIMTGQSTSPISNYSYFRTR